MSDYEAEGFAIVRAGLVVIGSEILSGRTLDKNTQHIAQRLNEKGIILAEVRIVADVEEQIAEAVNALRSQMDYVFTTGGIGPTHDDITTESIASAFGVRVSVHEQAYARLLEYYGEKEFTPARQRMARIPIGASLIDNPVSIAPGFVLDNVYVMAGVPRIMQAMFENVLLTLQGGVLIHSLTITCNLRESQLADPLGRVQDQFDDVEIGSYPFFQDGNVGVSVVLRAFDLKALEEAAQAVHAAMEALGGASERLF